MKWNEKLKAIVMRKNGRSYSDILKDIKVSKSTLSIWLSDIKLTNKQKIDLLKKTELARYKLGKYKHQKRLDKTKEIINESKKEFYELINNPLFISGISLYWAEGDKHKGERVKFTNSDPFMIVLMMRWFREICNVEKGKFRISLHVHNLHSPSNVIEYWSKITDVSKTQFQKVYIKQSTLLQRRNVLYNGTCGIIVHDKNLFRRILGWKMALIDYLGVKKHAPVV